MEGFAGAKVERASLGELLSYLDLLDKLQATLRTATVTRNSIVGIRYGLISGSFIYGTAEYGYCS